MKLAWAIDVFPNDTLYTAEIRKNLEALSSEQGTIFLQDVK